MIVKVAVVKNLEKVQKAKVVNMNLGAKIGVIVVTVADGLVMLNNKVIMDIGVREAQKEEIEDQTIAVDKTIAQDKLIAEIRGGYEDSEVVRAGKEKEKGSWLSAIKKKFGRGVTINTQVAERLIAETYHEEGSINEEELEAKNTAAEVAHIVTGDGRHLVREGEGTDQIIVHVMVAQT